MTSEVLTASGRYQVSPHSCFACGELNEHGLHLVLHVSGDTCWTELTLEPRFQGWEGIAHGGILATILDEVMGWALASVDAWGFTARLSVEYKRPVRVGMRVRAEGRLVERRRRLLTLEGRIVDADDGEVLATADALYVAAPAAERDALKARYGFRLIPDGPASADTGGCGGEGVPEEPPRAGTESPR